MKMLETSNSQYDSFLFWRQPIPELDLTELEDLGKVVPIQKNQTKKQKLSQKREEQVDHELSEYTSFNYWREPIASIDALDFNLLL
ncbi:protein AF1q [Alosa pseudoharengus]|uniref:protein AF1q n=1 Tax=Alosa pseudoharengus TaxID=34774 RepID=UPI003F88ED03